MHVPCSEQAKYQSVDTAEGQSDDGFSQSSEAEDSAACCADRNTVKDRLSHVIATFGSF
jgi:hypothetical protein